MYATNLEVGPRMSDTFDQEEQLEQMQTSLLSSMIEMSTLQRLPCIKEIHQVCTGLDAPETGTPFWQMGWAQPFAWPTA